MVSETVLWLVGIPLVSSPVVYLFGRIATRLARSVKAVNPARWLCLIALAAGFIPLINAFQLFANSGPLSYSFGAITLSVDGLSLLMGAVVLSLSLVVTLFSGPYLANEQGEEKYYALLIAMTGAIIGLVCSADLFNLWVWFETMAIASFMLVSFYREHKGALEAGMKYLVQSAAGSVMVILGIALVLAATGQLNLAGIHTAIQNQPGLTPVLLAAGALFVVGFGVKAALVPLHTWLPDAHSQAPSGISAMLSGIVIEAGLIAMLRSLGPLVGLSNNWGALLVVFGAVNMLAGNLLALRQVQVKRLLAFSSLSHMGYILLGFGIAVGFQSANGAQGGFFHLINHAMMKGLAFLCAGALMYAMFASRGSHASIAISDLNGASRRYPLVAIAFSIALLGLGGLPPLSGFMSKWQIFLAGFQTGSPWIIAAVVFAAFNSVLSLGYYVPMINAMYRHTPSEAVQHGHAVPPEMGIALAILAAGIVILGIWPGLADGIIVPAGNALLAVFGG